MIKKISSPFLGFIFFFSLSEQALAKTEAKQSVGLNFTSNANLVNENKIGDFYTQLNSRVSTEFSAVPVYFNLGWLNYFKETSNNFLSVSLSADIEATQFKTTSTYWIPKLFHRNYLRDNAATSDSSFTHTGLGLDLEKIFIKKSDFSLSAMAGYETRLFSKFQNRNDHEIHFLSDLKYSIDPILKLSAFGGLGLVSSSLSEYSRNYIEFGGGLKSDTEEKINWGSEAVLVQTTYVNRTISQATEITKRRGGTSTKIVESKETTQFVSVKGQIIYTVRPEWFVQTGLSMNTQSSNNPINSYSAIEISVSLFTTALP